jgi:hypothetical protein
MSDSKDSRSQRLHDLRGIHANFKAVLRLLKSGYRFDDEEAPAVLARLEQAVSGLEAEIRALDQEWKKG